MQPPFFPNPIFGWVFFSLLMGLLAAAAYYDIQTARIPKGVTLTIVGLGVLANIVRGYWLGSIGLETWELGRGSAVAGAVDGLLFSLLGLIIAFILFFGMWMLGSCGGGDVKLCAGIGAWIGAVYTIFLLLATVVALVVWMFLKVARALSNGAPSLKAIVRTKQKTANAKRKLKPGELPDRQMTFSMPALMAAAVVMLYVFRFDLQLEPRPPEPEKEAQHAAAPVANR